MIVVDVDVVEIGAVLVVGSEVKLDVVGLFVDVVDVVFVIVVVVEVVVDAVVVVVVVVVLDLVV